MFLVTSKWTKKRHPLIHVDDDDDDYDDDDDDDIVGHPLVEVPLNRTMGWDSMIFSASKGTQLLLFR